MAAPSIAQPPEASAATGRSRLPVVPFRSAFAFILGAAALAGAATGPLAEWNFDDSSPSATRDEVSHVSDPILGFSARVPGVAGHALRFDGYTTAVRRLAAQAPRLTDGATVDCWLSLQAYPWASCALVAQVAQAEPKIAATEGMINLTPENTPTDPVPTAGYFLGIDSDGRVSFQLLLDEGWVTCRTQQTVPLMAWTHVAGTYDAKDGRISVYVNGVSAGSTAGHGAIRAATAEDLFIGHNARGRMPDHQIRLGIPANFGVEGFLDRVQIFGRALAPREIRELVATANPPGDTGQRPEKLPEAGPAPGGFGAYYTQLKFNDAWDASRRDGPASDVVVLFDLHPWKLMFWRGTSYIPHWVTENGIWYTNEFTETWGAGALGCAEPMSDKQTRFSRVSILESSPARAVVHWRYALVDTRYHPPQVDPQSDWSDWSDEYYTIYPDGVGVRKICLWSTQPNAPHEFQESIVLIPPGKRPEDLIETNAVTTANLEGEEHVYSWAQGPPEKIDLPARANIEVINVKSAARPFLVVSDAPFAAYGEPHPAPAFRSMQVEIDRSRSIFPWWNHWPVAQIPSDGRWATHADRMAHSSLTTGLEWQDWSSTANSRTRIMLHGLTELPARNLATVARSWLKSPPASVRTGITGIRYDESERAYVLGNATGPGPIRISIGADHDYPLYHPAFIVRNWGEATARVLITGVAAPDRTEIRTGWRHGIDGTDLVVWMDLEATQPVDLEFQPTR